MNAPILQQDHTIFIWMRYLRGLRIAFGAKEVLTSDSEDDREIAKALEER